jgi:site-specific DNA recombinase
MKTAAIYARVSTADQVKGTSLDGQVALCQDFAKEAGYSVVKVMQEDASGARIDRPKLGELRNMAEKHEIEALIVFDPDRLSRSMAHTMMLMEEFERNCADVIFVNAPREDTPEGEMLFGMRALFAQYERTKIMERTRRGRERRAREGKVLMSTRIPYGYAMIAGEKRLAIVEGEAVWVRRMYGWLLEEHSSLGEIKRRLDAAGVPTKHGAPCWQRSTIQRILANEAYTGEWFYNQHESVLPQNPKRPENAGKKWSKGLKPRSEWIAVPVPAIISQDVYQAALVQLTANKGNSPRNAKHPYLLRGLFTCSYCGYKMHGTCRDGGTRSCYSCAGRRMHQLHLPLAERCPGRSYDGAKMERLVWEEITRQLSDPALIQNMLQERLAARGEEQAKDEGELGVLYDMEQALKRDAGKLLDLHMADLVDRDTLRERMEIIKKKQEAVQTGKVEIVQRMKARDNSQGSIEDIEALCRRVQKGLPNLDFDDKRAFLEAAQVQIAAMGNQISITGLITDAILSVDTSLAKRPKVEDIAGHVVLCPSYLEGYVRVALLRPDGTS